MVVEQVIEFTIQVKQKVREEIAPPLRRYGGYLLLIAVLLIGYWLISMLLSGFPPQHTPDWFSTVIVGLSEDIHFLADTLTPQTLVVDAGDALLRFSYSAGIVIATVILMTIGAGIIIETVNFLIQLVTHKTELQDE